MSIYNVNTYLYFANRFSPKLETKFPTFATAFKIILRYFH